MKTRFKARVNSIKEGLGRGYTGFCRRFPRVAIFMGLIHRRRRPLKGLFIVVAHTLGFIFSIQAVMQTRTEQGAVAWVFALNTIPVVAVPAWFVFGNNKVEVYQSAKRVGIEEVRPLAEKLLKNLDRATANPQEIESGETGAPAPNPSEVMNRLETIGSLPLLKGNSAKLLVDGFISGADRNDLKKQWLQSLANKQLEWYAEQKAESGAYAALLGLTLQSSDNGGSWEAEAIGDCCLMLVRDGNLIEKFPLTESEQFNSSPVLLSSTSDGEEAELEEALVKISGSWQPGDVFYLMSDAIARWAYQRQEEHSDAVLFLKGMLEQKDIEQLAEVQRTLLDADSRPLMRNDDITLMRVIVS